MEHRAVGKGKRENGKSGGGKGKSKR